jgi:hypothetical protein
MLDLISRVKHDRMAMTIFLLTMLPTDTTPPWLHWKGCELQFSAYGAPIWTWFLSTTYQRWDATFLLTFGGRVSQRRAGDGDVDCSKLGVGEQLLWCTPDDGKGIYGGCGLRWSSRGGWLGMGHGVEALRQWWELARVWLPKAWNPSVGLDCI